MTVEGGLVTRRTLATSVPLGMRAKAKELDRRASLLDALAKLLFGLASSARCCNRFSQPVTRNYDHAVAIADHDVARTHVHTA